MLHRGQELAPLAGGAPVTAVRGAAAPAGRRGRVRRRTLALGEEGRVREGDGAVVDVGAVAVAVDEDLAEGLARLRVAHREGGDGGLVAGARGGGEGGLQVGGGPGAHVRGWVQGEGLGPRRCRWGG